MGNDLSVNDSLLREYKFEKIVDIIPYGKIKVLQHYISSKKLACKTILSLDLSTEKSLMQKLELNNECKNLISIFMKFKDNSSFCGDIRKVTLYALYSEFNLLNVKFFKGKGKRSVAHDFVEWDYVRIAIGVLNALDFLHNKEYFHGGICAESILFHDGDYKLLVPDYYSNRSSFDNILNYQNFPCALSPEEFKALEIGVIPEFLDRKPCDIFSLGITLLCFIEGLDIRKFYNFEDFSLNFDLIKEALRTLQTRISTQFFSAIILMLEIDPSERISASEALKIISICKNSTLSFSQNLSFSRNFAMNSTLTPDISNNSIVISKEKPKKARNKHSLPVKKYKIMVFFDKEDEFSQILNEIKDLNDRIDNEIKYQF